MAIFNESGNLVTAGFSAGGYNSVSDTQDFNKLDRMIESLYWEAKGEIDCLSSLCEAGKISGAWTSFKTWFLGIIKKIGDAWNELIDKISVWANKMPIKGKEKIIRAAHNSYSIGDDNLKMSDKVREKLDGYIADYKKLPKKTIKDIADLSKKGVGAYKNTLNSSKGMGSGATLNTVGAPVYSDKIGAAIGVTNMGTSAEQYQSQIDGIFEAGANSYDINEIYTTAIDTGKSLAECKNLAKDIKNLEKEVGNLVKSSEEEDPEVEPLIQGAKYGLMVVTYLNTKAMGFVRKKISLASKICMQLIHTKGGSESTNSDDNLFASGPNDDEN